MWAPKPSLHPILIHMDHHAGDGFRSVPIMDAAAADLRTGASGADVFGGSPAGSRRRGRTASSRIMLAMESGSACSMTRT